MPRGRVDQSALRCQRVRLYSAREQAAKRDCRRSLPLGCLEAALSWSAPLGACRAIYYPADRVERRITRVSTPAAVAANSATSAVGGRQLCWREDSVQTLGKDRDRQQPIVSFVPGF